jgi:ATP-binding cassette subfamily B protein
MLKLMKYLNWKEWIAIVFVLGITVVQALCNLWLVEYMGDIVGNISAGAVMGDMNMFWGDILTSAGMMFLMVAVVVTASILSNYLASIVTTNMSARIRRDLFSTVNNFSMSEINKFSVPSLITRSTNDITQFQNVLMMVLSLGLTAPLMAVLAIIKIVGISGSLSIVAAVAVVALVAFIIAMFFLVVPKFKSIQKLTDNLNLVARENLTGIRVVRANNAEETQEKKFSKANEDITGTHIYIGKVTSMINPVISIIMNISTLAIVWISAVIIINNPANLARDMENMTTFTQYTMQIIMSFMILSMMLIMIPRSMVSAKRINEVLQTKSSVVDGIGVPLTDERGTIEFKDVSFKYPGADKKVLEDISFEIKRGETVAFIGSTGSGKSTLINLIPRFYDCTEGEILIDGYNVKDYKLHELNDKLGYVPQKGVLFSGSVEENIRYGNEQADDEMIKKAIEVSQSKFVYSMEEGIDHPISQGGKNISGGQKQRLSIARAIVKNPEIFIFDDSFSALDFKTDKSLRKALKKHTKNSTVLIVAQRIGTIMDADKIVVLDNGRIVGTGKHDELMENCQVYKEIALSQLSKEEL